MLPSFSSLLIHNSNTGRYQPSLWPLNLCYGVTGWLHCADPRACPGCLGSRGEVCWPHGQGSQEWRVLQVVIICYFFSLFSTLNIYPKCYHYCYYYKWFFSNLGWIIWSRPTWRSSALTRKQHLSSRYLSSYKHKICPFFSPYNVWKLCRSRSATLLKNRISGAELEPPGAGCPVMEPTFKVSTF